MLWPHESVGVLDRQGVTEAFQAGYPALISIWRFPKLRVPPVLIHFNSWLVVWCGLEHEFYDFPFSWECHTPNWRTHIYQRGWHHQPDRLFQYKSTIFGYPRFRKAPCCLMLPMLSCHGWFSGWWSNGSPFFPHTSNKIADGATKK